MERNSDLSQTGKCFYIRPQKMANKTVSLNNSIQQLEYKCEYLYIYTCTCLYIHVYALIYLMYKYAFLKPQLTSGFLGVCCCCCLLNNNYFLIKYFTS